MRKLKFANLLCSVLAIASFSSCNSDEPQVTPDENAEVANLPVLFDNKEGIQEIEVKQSQTIAKGTYVLKGWCYVTAGTTLTIEAGTIIRGDKESKAALIIEPGGKLIAKGTKDSPIVMTSAKSRGERRPGDWGGLIICGNAKNNRGQMQIEGGPRTKHGGNDDNDNSGVISYVRVEFAGYPFGKDQEINGITFGSVGKATTIDHLQVSYSNDDSYEWFGGNVNAKYLIAYHGWDDEFDTDNGFSGKLQFLLGVRSPRIADQSLSNGFESDNNSDGTTEPNITDCVFSNVTFVGPIGQADDFSNISSYINGGGLNPVNGSGLGTYQAAMQIRRSSRLRCFNSIAMGYPVGLIIDGEKGQSQSYAKDGSLQLDNLYFAQMGILGCDANKLWKDVMVSYEIDENGKKVMVLDETQTSFSHKYFISQSGNKYYNTIGELGLSQPNSMISGFDCRPKAGSLLLNKTNLFANTLLSDSYFDKNVNYIGAFSESDNWMEGWSNFDPQNTVY